MPVTLSKTDYLLYRECPKNVWFKIYKPDLYFESELSDFEKSIIETGNEVELVARKLFPTGILIEGRDVAAQKTTQDYITNKESVIFQAIFAKDGFLAALDILELDKKTGEYSIYEVKSTNEVDPKVHYYDLAFQVNLLKKFGIKIKKAYVIHLDPEYVRYGALDINKLFGNPEDVTKEVESLCDAVMEQMEEALAYISKDVEPKGFCCCVYKGRSKHCATFRHSNPQIPEYSIHDIARIGSSKAKIQQLIDENIFRLEDIPDHIKLTEIQKNQVDAYVLDRTIINKENIVEELRGLIFPLYFLDYETFPCAIPRFNGFSPHQQIPFQYSLHILRSPDSEPEHTEFLYVGSGDPSESLVASLQKDIGSTGSVIVWSKKFECSINEKIGERIPEVKPFIDSLNNRVYDLMDIFSKQHYVHKNFLGSTSIKYVLPVIAPELAYDDLEIKEGGTASQSWNKIVTDMVSAEQKKKIADDLKKYCCRDTYAMYAIWENLYKLT